MVSLFSGRRRIVLDTKPFVLLVIGLIDKDYIKKFSSTKEFSEEEFDLLSKVVGKYKQIIVTPHVLAEFSHFTIEKSELRDDYRKKIVAWMKNVSFSGGIQAQGVKLSAILDDTNVYVLGVADTSLLNIRVGKNTPIITSDGRLADRARMAGLNARKFVPTLGFVNY